MARRPGQAGIVLKGARAERLIAELPGTDGGQEQLALARATGNLKRGNERLFKGGNGRRRR